MFQGPKSPFEQEDSTFQVVGLSAEKEVVTTGPVNAITKFLASERWYVF
jgi:hypothetical protein